MPQSDEIRRLAKRWAGGTGWPRRLQWLELKGVRGWQGQRLNLPFPIVAITGENGAAKAHYFKRRLAYIAPIKLVRAPGSLLNFSQTLLGTR